MTTDPKSITVDQLTTSLRGWGIDLDDVRSLRIDATYDGGMIELVRYRTDDEGHKFLIDGDQPATDTHHIAIVRPKPAEEAITR